jgi:glycine/D-amino acid oxidase-like deaminating enzyme
MLTRTLTAMSPALRGIGVVGEWGGPLGVPRDWSPSVGYHPASGTARAGGYVGQGVSTANLAGRTLRDLLLGPVS